jgi:hypothetical protein
MDETSTRSGVGEFIAPLRPEGTAPGTSLQRDEHPDWRRRALLRVDPRRLCHRNGPDLVRFDDTDDGRHVSDTAGHEGVTATSGTPAGTGVHSVPSLSQRSVRWQGVIRQLRIYEIFDETKEAFHERFRDHAARIMARYRFSIIAGWESSIDGRPEFVYLLEWPDETTMKDRWTAFMADEEWAQIKRETSALHGQMVGSIQDRVLRPVDYLPTI